MKKKDNAQEPEKKDSLDYAEETLPYEDSQPKEDGVEYDGDEYYDDEYYDDEYYDEDYDGDYDENYDDAPAEKKPRSLKHTIIYMLVVLGLSLALAVAMWFAADDVLALTKSDNVVTVTIQDSDTLEDVAQNLKDHGLVRYKFLFILYGKFSHAEEKFSAGTFELNQLFDYHALVNGLASSSEARKTVTLTFPEGYSCDQIFSMLADNDVCTLEDLEDTAANYEFDFDFLQDLSYGDQNRLEGYLFPDTYEFYKNHNAKNALGKLIDAFADRIDEDAFASSKAKSMGYSMKDVVIIASLIEKETDGTDQRDIASVIYNRLQKPGETVGLLQIDASLLYGLPDHTGAITNADKAVDTPYNLYLHKGLPPTAIANPGSAALKAAMDPNDTDYYYYALGTDGKHHFSKTLSEHNAFVGSSSYGG